MLKYFCDRCGNEMSSYDYDHAAQVTISDDNDDMKIYTVCRNCEFAVRHFLKDGQFKAGEQ